MKTSTLLSLASSVSYLPVSHAAVSFSFAKHLPKDGGHETSSSARRSSDSSINAGLAYQDAIYVVNVTVGTPGQPMSLQLSPSASNTFVMDARSYWCTTFASSSDYYDDEEEEEDDDDVNGSDTTDSALCAWGTFSSGNSTSYKSLETTTSDSSSSYGTSTDFYEDYNGGAYAYGAYMSDVLTVAGTTVSNLTMGLVNETSSTSLPGAYAAGYMGVLGIGYNDTDYDNLPNRLQRDGLINSTAYSLWVDDEAASSGNLLFGAVDTARFEGSLTRLLSQHSYYTMTVQVVGINGSTTKSGGPVAVTTTSSSDDDGDDGYLFTALYSPPDTLSNLPTDIASQIWQMAGAYYDDRLGKAVVSCSAAGDATNFTIQLGGNGAKGPVVSALMSDLVIPAAEFNLSSYSYYYYDTESTNDSNMCLFGVQNGSVSSSYYTSYNLGSTLLRRTYSVFDLVNNEVAVAPVRFGASATSNVVPFASYGAAVPSSTILCVYSDCFEDAGSNDDDDDSDETGGTGRLRGVLSVGALVGMSAGIALGFLALGLAGIFLWRHRRNRGLAAKEESGTSVLSAEAGEGAPVMSRAGAAAPEMGETPAQAPAGAPVGKGKEPEVREPVPGSSIGDPHATSTGATEAESTYHADHGEASSSRNV